MLADERRASRGLRSHSPVPRITSSGATEEYTVDVDYSQVIQMGEIDVFVLLDRLSGGEGIVGG